MTTLLQIVKRLQELAPPELTIQGLQSRVEIGPQTQTDQSNTTVNRILIATYPSARVVTKASQDKSNLLVTYRQLFPFVIDRLSGLDLVRVRLLTKNYISSYVIGSGYLCARDGLNDAFVDALGLGKLSEFSTESDLGQMAAIGKICKPPGVKNHSGFANYIASKMNLNNVLFTGDLDDEVGDILVSAGYHLDMPEIINIKKEDLKTIVTGELSPEIRLLAKEEGLNTFELGAFVTEDPGMKRLRDTMSLEFTEVKVDFIAAMPLTQGLKPYKDEMA